MSGGDKSDKRWRKYLIRKGERMLRYGVIDRKLNSICSTGTTLGSPTLTCIIVGVIINSYIKI